MRAQVEEKRRLRDAGGCRRRRARPRADVRGRHDGQAQPDGAGAQRVRRLGRGATTTGSGGAHSSRGPRRAPRISARTSECRAVAAARRLRAGAGRLGVPARREWRGAATERGLVPRRAGEGPATRGHRGAQPPPLRWAAPGRGQASAAAPCALQTPPLSHRRGSRTLMHGPRDSAIHILPSCPVWVRAQTLLRPGPPAWRTGHSRFWSVAAQGPPDPLVFLPASASLWPCRPRTASRRGQLSPLSLRRRFDESKPPPQRCVRLSLWRMQSVPREPQRE